MKLRVGIPLIQSELNGRVGWIAGFYYVRNCLNALATLPIEEVPEIIVFMPDSLDESLMFSEHADNATWLTEVRIPDDIIRENRTELQQHIDRYPCDLIFPLTSIPRVCFPARAIGWIPDFQHKYYPKYFSPEEIRDRDLLYKFIAGYCDRVICSSQTVKEDLTNYINCPGEKGALLRFRTVLPQQYLQNFPTPILSKLNITEKYAYLPNQFWVHKNHKTVFESWKYLKSQGKNFLLVCTGQTSDYRFPGYYQELMEYLHENDLFSNIRLMGFLSRLEQIQLYRGASVVLQPSVFEGWSTSIEEAISLGKPLIVSDIPVHREQCGTEARYFQKNNAEDLANILSDSWDVLPDGHSSALEFKALAKSQRRVEEFGKNLVGIINDTVRGHDASTHDKVLLLPLITELTQHFGEAEADRAARLQVIEEQGRRLGEVEAERNILQSELASLRQHFESAEADRAARLEVIEDQGRRLGEVEAERNILQSELASLRQRFSELQSELASLRQRFSELQSERDGALQVLFSVSKSRAYKLLRRLGRWKAIEQLISDISEGSMPPAGYKDVEMALLERLGPDHLASLISNAYAHDDLLFSTCEKYGFHLTPVHFYSPIPEVSKLPKKIWEQSSELMGVELNEQAQLAFLDQICQKYKAEYEAFPVNPTNVPHQYHFNQMMFRSVDAEVLYCMIRYHCPLRVIEVGSGFSTYVAAAAVVRNAEQGKPAEFFAIEPYPNEVLRQGFPGLQRLISEPVQDVDLDLFTTLTEGDILFIDSSHVLRIDSDVRFLFLEVLPRLQPGVLVHFHDIFLPLDYPQDWLIKEHRFWNEQYLLQAFLAFNRAFEVIWAGSFMHQYHSDAIKKVFSHYDPHTVTPGSFWVRRKDL